MMLLKTADGPDPTPPMLKHPPTPLSVTSTLTPMAITHSVGKENMTPLVAQTHRTRWADYLKELLNKTRTRPHC